jgi:methionine-rich copper-binding protein CopC
LAIKRSSGKDDKRFDARVGDSFAEGIMKISTLSLMGLLFGAWIAAPQVAWAGTPTIDHADPKPGSEVDAPPTEIKVWFTDALDPMCRSLAVVDSQGNQVDAQDTHADPDDPKELIITIPNRIYDGEYTVKWDIATVDSKRNNGSFKFTINIKE